MRGRDEGMSLVEVLIVSLLSLVVLTGLASTLISGLRTSSFGSNQSQSLDGARLVLNQVERDLQGSKQFENCATSPVPAGSCILVVVQPPSGADQTVRYRLVGASLYREIDDGTGTFANSRIVTNKLANLTRAPASALFTCTNSGSLLQVNVNLVVQPDPANSPTFTLQTVIRPRNTYQPPSC
jgi:type II secretory pathway component PulJ